jgi:hypothetical protein
VIGQHSRGLYDGETAEESQLDDLAYTRIERCQSVECVAEGNDVECDRLWKLLHFIETQANRAATTFLAVPIARELDEDPSHHLRRQRQVTSRQCQRRNVAGVTMNVSRP